MSRVGAVVLILLFGVWLGSAAKEPDVEYRVRTVTEIETTTKEVPVTVPMPDACYETIELAKRLARAAIEIDGAQGEQMDNFSDARMAIVQQQVNRLSELENDQRRLIADALKQYIEIAKIQQTYPAVLFSCEEQMNE